jgi:hypothetical protein
LVAAPIYRAVLAAAMAVFATGALACARNEGRTPCEEIHAWDECEAANHCSPMRLIVDEGYEGPSWECVLDE